MIMDFHERVHGVAQSSLQESITKRIVIVDDPDPEGLKECVNVVR